MISSWLQIVSPRTAVFSAQEPYVLLLGATRYRMCRAALKFESGDVTFIQGTWCLLYGVQLHSWFAFSH